MPTKFIPFVQLVIASWIAKLLGWSGAVLATVGVTVSYTKDAPLNIAQVVVGLVLMVIHAVVSHLTLRSAHASLPPPANAPASPLRNLSAFLLAAGLGAAALGLSGCATSGSTTALTTSTGSISVPTSTLNTANTVANILQNFNTGLTASLPTVDQVLTATDNSGDEGIAQDVVVGTNLVTALVAAFNDTVQQAAAAGASTAQVQAAANATLSPTNVAAIAANVVASTPATTTN